MARATLPHHRKGTSSTHALRRALPAAPPRRAPSDYGGGNPCTLAPDPALDAAFTAAAVALMLNATALYGAPRLPLFLAVGPMSTCPANATRAAVAQLAALGADATFVDMSPGAPLDGCEWCVCACARRRDSSECPLAATPPSRPPCAPCTARSPRAGWNHPGVVGHRVMAANARPILAAVLGW